MSGAFRAAGAVWLWGPVVAFMAAIFVASATPVGPDTAVVLPDKLMHFATYAALALLILRALAAGQARGVTWSRAVWAVVMAVAYGVTDEVHQAFVPTRQPDVLDVVADAAGACVAVLVAGEWIRRRGV